MIFNSIFNETSLLPLQDQVEKNRRDIAALSSSVQPEQLTAADILADIDTGETQEDLNTIITDDLDTQANNISALDTRVTVLENNPSSVLTSGTMSLLITPFADIVNTTIGNYRLVALTDFSLNDVTSPVLGTLYKCFVALSNTEPLITSKLAALKSLGTNPSSPVLTPVSLLHATTLSTVADQTVMECIVAAEIGTNIGFGNLFTTVPYVRGD